MLISGQKWAKRYKTGVFVNVVQTCSMLIIRFSKNVFYPILTFAEGR